MRGLDTHLSYRIGLRTFSAMESRGVLGVPDAYELPLGAGQRLPEVRHRPGGPLQGRVRLRALPARAAGRAARARRGTADRAVRSRLHRAAAAPRPSRRRSRRPSPRGATRCSTSCPHGWTGRARPRTGSGCRRWPSRPRWTSCSRRCAVDPDARADDRALAGARAGCTAPVGVVDRPFEQRRDPLARPGRRRGARRPWPAARRAARATLLRTLIAGLALTHTPRRGAVLLPGLRRRRLASLAGLPHVGGVANRLDADRVRRTVAEVTTLLARRERAFAERGIDSMADLPAPAAAGSPRTTAASATCSSSSTAGSRSARTSSRWSPRSPSWPPAASASAST